MTGDLDARQAIIDGEHLRLLSIGFYVSAAMAAFFSLFGLLYVVLGILVAAAGEVGHASGNDLPPAILGWIFGGIGCGIFVLLLAAAILKFAAGRCIAKRKARVFCMVIGGFSCLEMPYGTVLGVFTLIVLGRPSVKAAFEAGTSTPPPAPGPDPLQA